MGHPVEGNQPLIVSVLVAVINSRTREQAVAIVLVRTGRGDAHIGRQKGGAAICRLCKEHVRLEARASRIVARVVERKIDVSGYWIDGKPLVEPVHGERQLVGDRPRSRPSGALIVGKGKEDVADATGRLVQPRAIEAAAMPAARTNRLARAVD